MSETQTNPTEVSPSEIDAAEVVTDVRSRVASLPPRPPDASRYVNRQEELRRLFDLPENGKGLRHILEALNNGGFVLRYVKPEDVLFTSEGDEGEDLGVGLLPILNGLCLVESTETRYNYTASVYKITDEGRHYLSTGELPAFPRSFRDVF